MEYVKNMLGEEWRQYQNTPYFFSNCGRVKKRHVRKESLLSPYPRYRNRNKSKTKLLAVHIVVDGKRKEVSLPRTIWELFNGPIPKGYCVHHKDNTFTNNDVRNLELVTQKQLGHISGGRTERRKLIYCPDNGKIYRGTRAAAKDLFVSRQTISDICNHKRKRAPIVRVRWMRDDE